MTGRQIEDVGEREPARLMGLYDVVAGGARAVAMVDWGSSAAAIGIR